MRWLKEPAFWGGLVIGYILVVAFPSLNIRAAGINASVGRS